MFYGLLGIIVGSFVIVKYLNYKIYHYKIKSPEQQSHTNPKFLRTGLKPDDTLAIIIISIDNPNIIPKILNLIMTTDRFQANNLNKNQIYGQRIDNSIIYGLNISSSIEPLEILNFISYWVDSLKYYDWFKLIFTTNNHDNISKYFNCLGTFIGFNNLIFNKENIIKVIDQVPIFRNLIFLPVSPLSLSDNL